MPTVQARIPTARAGRYLVQLCRHASQIGGRGGHARFAHRGRTGAGIHERGHIEVDAQWTETTGVIKFAPYGRCVVEATDTEFVVRIEAVEEDKLARIQQIVTDDLSRFGRRDGLEVRWSVVEDDEDAARA